MNRLLYLLLVCALAAPVAAAPQQPAPEFAVQLAAVEKAVDAKRQELGIPGVSLAIVKDDKVIYLKGLGLRDIARKKPVTPDTLFAIGSSSKAFTAMSVVMAADDGKLTLGDPPKRFLPYFKLQDPEADAKITVRDLLCHRSGLNRTDIAWYSNALTRDQVIEVASHAKATAKLGEKWQYQNVMFLAAGQIAARAENTTYEKLVTDRIFKPLGMKSANFSVKQMQKSRDYSLGYDYNFETKETRNLPTRDLTVIAPAGAINASAREMAEWVRLMLGGGVYNGKRLVSEQGFAEIVKPQMKVAGKVDYGLGWFLRDWNGHKVVEHGGNIDGFNAQVALMPDQNLGFVLLTNVSGSPLGDFTMNTVWTSFLGDPNAAAAAAAAADPGADVDPKTEAGTYAFPEAGFDVTVDYMDGKLSLTVPGQPVYPLENVAGRRYKLGAPAPSGFFATFRPIKDNPSSTEIYLEQPQGNFVLTRKTAVAPSTDAAAPGATALGELLGNYRATDDENRTVEIANLGGKVSLVVPGQPPYPLVDKAKDVFSLGGLPADFEVTLRRGSDAKVAGFSIKQPNGTFEFVRAAIAKPEITVDELSAKVIKAAGGEANIRKHTSVVTDVEMDFVHQGIQAKGSNYAKAPAMAASTTTLLALGKPIGTARSYFDGAAGGETVSFAPAETYSGKRLEDAKIESDFYEVLRWKQLYKDVTIKGKQKVDDEECYVVVKIPEKGNPVTDYYSTRTFLLKRRDSISWSETTNTGFPSTSRFDDYRVIGGVSVPFLVTTNNLANGDIVTKIKRIQMDAAIPDAEFKPK